MGKIILLYGLNIVCSAAIYKLLLQQKTDPSISRRIILDILCFPFILIPINICINHNLIFHSIKIVVPEFLIGVYILGVATLSVISLINWLRLFIIKRQSKILEIRNKKCFVHTNNQLNCFSWMNDIYFPCDFNKWNEEEIQMILSHEEAHIHFHHFLDLVLIQVLCIFQWFNPAIWYWKLELRRIHEYEADYHVVSNTGIKKKSYEHFLLRVSNDNTFFGNVEGFKSESLKLRIIMMNNKNKIKNWVERGSIIFFLSILISLFF